jgi:hypothetical protein
MVRRSNFHHSYNRITKNMKRHINNDLETTIKWYSCQEDEIVEVDELVSPAGGGACALPPPIHTIIARVSANTEYGSCRQVRQQDRAIVSKSQCRSADQAQHSLGPTYRFVCF